MSNRPDLNFMKHDLTALLKVLGNEGAGNHGPCRFCNDETALSVQHVGAAWLFNCHRCGAAGSIVDALALAEGISVDAAIERLAGWGYESRRAQACKRATFIEPRTPVPDIAYLQKIHNCATQTLLNNADLRAYWLGKRGIPLVTAKALELGFLPSIRFNGWPETKDAWVIPISDASGKVLALKLHKENSNNGPKCLWAPLGTEPKDKPMNGWSTLWPPPESYWVTDDFQELAAKLEFDCGLDRPDAERRARLEVFTKLPWLYLCPGELKAAAVVGAGKQATSITAGESHKWTPDFVARLSGRRVCIVFDDDPAGHKFRDTAAAALCSVAVELKTITFGRNEK